MLNIIAIAPYYEKSQPEAAFQARQNVKDLSAASSDKYLSVNYHSHLPT